MIASNETSQIISISCGQQVKYAFHDTPVTATIERIREIRTARYLDSFTGPANDVVITLQMSDGIASARGWELIV